jgi:branched-chain amino acid transport system substrate-binding protein
VKRPREERGGIMHRFRLPFLAGLFALSVVAAACAGEDTPQVEDQEGEPIRIGAVLGFSGLLEPYEGEAFVTAELAVEDINAEGGVLGRPLELFQRDTKSDPNLAPTAALEAIDMGADVILTSDFDFGGPAALAACDRNVLALSLHASPPKFGPAGLCPLAFSAGIMTPNEAAVLSEWAYNEQGWRTAYELEDVSIEYTRSFHLYFREAWERLGGEIVDRDTWENSDQSIAAQITRINGLPTPPDFIHMTTYNPGGASAVRQIRAAGIDLPIVGGQPMDGTYWLDAVPDLSDFYLSTYASFNGDDSDPFINELRERFMEKTGEYPTLSYFVNGYNAIDLLVQGIEEAGTVEAEPLAEALEGFDDVVSRPLGRTCFTEEWHVSLCRPFAIVTYQEGTPEFVGRFEAGFVPDPRLDV